MPNYSQRSKNNLSTCHPDIQVLMNEVILSYDVSIIYGYRAIIEQNRLYRKGRKKIHGTNGTLREHYLIVNESEVVTFRGYDKPSNHNVSPSLAVDCIPYPSGWSSNEKVYEMAGYIKAVYHRLLGEGRINAKLRFGSDWTHPPDPAHIEIVT